MNNKTSRDALRRQRQGIVRELRANNGNVAATARKFGVKRDLVRRLRDFHGIGPAPTPSATRGPRKHQRARVLQALASNGGNVKQTIADTGIPETTVRRWKAEAVVPWRRIDLSELLARTQPDEDSGCLLWTGRTNGSYGVTDLGGKARLAHRVAYELTHRVTLGPDQHAHHICHRPACINPAHLLIVHGAGERGHHALHTLEAELAATFEEDAPHLTLTA